MRRSLAAIAVCLLTLSACGSRSSSPGASATHSSSRCPSVLILGLRGQGQSATAHRGMGATVLNVAERLSATLKSQGRTVRMQAVLHPARRSPTLASYDADIASGRRMTVDAMATETRSCPSTRFALIGYSEGAQVTHLAVAGLGAAAAARVASVTLIGDPLRDPDAAGVRQLHLGTTMTVGHGSNGTSPGLGALASRTVSVCVSGDNVCNMPPAGRDGKPVSAAHRESYRTPAAAKAIAAATTQVIR